MAGPSLSRPNGDLSDTAGQSDNTSNHFATAGFQAVNKQAVAENASVPSGPTPPGVASAAHNSTGSPAVAPSSRITSNSQVPPSNMDALDGAMTDTATYGTRSRNRTGNARPNYAEDHEMDFEFSSAATTKKKSTNEAAPPAQAVAEVKRADDFARLIGGSSKESTPVTSGAAAGSSKKRKAAGGVPQQAQTPPVPSAPASTTVRKSTSTNAASAMARETNVMSFSKHRKCLNKKGELIADDGTKLAVNDHVYLVCEPPGDPYYLCRIMEFLHEDAANPNSPIDSLRVNWYYRPRDVQRFNSDTRLLYGTMHSDMCPLSSLRGKCTIKHRSEIQDLDAYRKERDSFYFVQIFDRFIRRWYECIPVSQIINVPDKVKKALDERWKFVVVEIGRVKELTSEVKTCKRCARYCASNDSVDCAICKNSYHMNCVQPPLPKKPSRGFAWACGPCSRASEKQLEARSTPTVSGDVTEAEEELLEEEDPKAISNDSTRAPSPSGEDVVLQAHPVTAAEVALAKMWPMRYLGIHCRVEDALQYDDRAIYPRASSRLGPRHQANISMWPGRPVELVKPAEIKKRYNKNTASHKKEGKLTKETVAALEADREEKARRPKWVQDEPPGYVARGEDYPEDDPRCTAKLISKPPQKGPEYLPQPDAFVDKYVKDAKIYSRAIGVPSFGVNFLDKALELFTACNYDSRAAINKLKTMDRKKDLHEPILTKQDLLKFEEGVAKYGSEHRLIRLHMKTNLPNSDIVRFYYLWKKTPKGREIWGNYGGRKGSKRKVENDTGAKLQVEVANQDDDSAFDYDKAVRKNKGFICKFCNTTHARQWRKAPGVAPGQTIMSDAKSGNKDKKDRLILAICLRCAGLWRKYAIQWEDIDEVAKKVAQGGGRAWKRRIDEELLRELMAANEAASMPVQEPPAALPSIEAPGEPPKKKSKTDKDVVTPQPEVPKKKEKPPPPPKEPTPPPPPIIPTPPQWKVLPCAVCRNVGETIACAHCRLTVHRQCFGLNESDGVRPDGSVSWVCEQCQNDRYPEVSTEYACCLCLTEETSVDLVEPPKVSHKKKTDREREKERMEKELADGMRAEYRNRQLSLNRPFFPREPLKKTTGNNWVHVYCAVWTPEIRFSNAPRLEVAEGFQNIPPPRYDAVCKLCKNKDHNNKVREDAGACVSCFQCHANFHASCAFEAGYQFGFDVTPVKGSRKDQITTATLGEETGSLTAGIWCKEHVVKSIVHPMNEFVDDNGRTALQVFAENYKQADLTLTGTVRKANLAQLTKDKGQQAAPAASAAGRRESTAHSIAAAVRRGARNSSAADAKSEAEDGATQISDVPEVKAERRCIKCKIDVTPRWHAVTRTPPPSPPIRRRMSMTLGEYAELQRQNSSEPNRNGPNVDITGAPITRPPLPDTPRSQQNIRFMAPGANGRAWESTADRSGPPAVNGDSRASEHTPGALSVVPSREVPTPHTNGEPQPPTENGEGPDGAFHTSALPHFDNPADPPAPPTQPPDTAAINSEVQEYLCHKCFIKKKTNPTPSPPPPAPPVELSPPRTFPLQLGWGRPGGAPPSQQPSAPARDGPIRMPWDDPPPRQSQPPQQPQQPYANGTGPQGPPPPSYGPPPPSHTPSYPPYGQPNGYPAPPQQHQGPHPQHHGPPPPHAPPMHERQHSYGNPYAPPPPNPQQAFGPPRPSPMPAYGPPTSQPMANGVHSPHTGQPPLQSPTHPYGPPPPQHHGFGPPRRTESPFNAQLPPIGQPLHSSPQTSFTRPDIMNGPPPSQAPQAPLAQQQQQAQQQAQQQQQPPVSQLQQPSAPAPSQAQAPPAQQSTTTQAPATNGQTPQPPLQPQFGSPQPGQAQLDGQARPTTPREGAAVPGGPGASASPSLRNLLH